MLGVAAGALFAGSVVTETVFARSGLGAMLLRSVIEQDIALVQGLVLITAIVFVGVSLLVDLIYPLLDPRIVSAARTSPKALHA